MKQIYYVIQALIHGRGANIIKMDSKWRAFSSE